MRRVLGIVPARRGSKRIIDKNLRIFAGKPLVLRAVETALAAQRLARVCVSSDDQRVLDVTRVLPGVTAIQRPAELAQDESPAIDYVRHALQVLEAASDDAFDAVAILQPTSPFTLPEDVDATVRLLHESGADSAVSVMKLDHAIHPAKLKRMSGDRLLPYFEDERGRMAAHELPEVYVRNCSVYATKRTVVDRGLIIGDDCRGYLMPRSRSLDINDEFDLAVAEVMHTRGHMSRATRLLEADACVQALDLAAARSGRMRLVGTSDLTLIGALRTHLTLRVADAYEVARPARRDATDAVRALASRFRSRTPRSRFTTSRRPSVLVLPRQWNHFRDLTPISKRLLGFGDVRPVWLLFQDAHAGLARDAGTEFVLARSVADTRAAAHARLYWECLGLRSATVPRPHDISDEQWRLTMRVARSYLPSQVPSALLAASAVENAIAALKPAVVAVSHPCTLEAVVALACARAHSIPSVCIQPSLIAASDPTWWPSPVDRLYAWGEESRRVLVARGFPQSAIEVTGPVWTDLVSPVRSMNGNAARPRALVALSGPGHSISHEEHELLIRRILRASADLEDFDFEYRLHPKDSPKFWANLMRETPGSRGNVVPNSSDREPIETRLIGAAVLVTVGSTAAVDALYAGVPVVTLARAGAPDAEFVGAGATNHVAPGDDLAIAIREATTTRDPIRWTAAETYLGHLLGPRDGQAHERIALSIRNVVHGGIS